jgi:uncharacterized protein YdiU (UPF0061 family)
MIKVSIGINVVDDELDSGLRFDHSFVENLKGFYVECKGDKAPSAKLIKLNNTLARQLGLNTQNLSKAQLAAMLAGGMQVKGTEGVAQVYAGHQFGNFNPQLGDGRALLLGEVIDKQGARLDIHLKGSGRTAFSRSGDGKAVVGPVLREYLLAEAMFHLNVPTTRALAIVTTGERIMRNQLLPGAVLARVATSHIRVGTFQFFAARGDQESVKRLADYCIDRHYPDLIEDENPALALLDKVSQQQALLIAKWMSIGFVHGVMNTDNCTISGETIDYGPCAFLDAYEPQQVFSSIDAQGRYAYANQPRIGKWNMARFAETLLELFDNDESQAVELATQVLDKFDDYYHDFWLELMRTKIGLVTLPVADTAELGVSLQESDANLITALLGLMSESQLDYSQLFRALSNTLEGNLSAVKSMFKESQQGNFQKFVIWHQQWLTRIDLEKHAVDEIKALMETNNPAYIPRNHLVEKVIEAAQQQGDFSEFEKLLKVLQNPFDEDPDLKAYTQSAPDNFGNYTTFCGT